MEEVLPTGMERHPKTGMLWARKDVPARYTTPTGAVINLREIVGKRTLKRTLKTKDLAVARLTFHDVMSEFEATIARAKASVTGEFTGFGTITMAPNQRSAFEAWQVTRPEHQTRVTVERLQRQLEAAKVISSPREPISIGEIFAKWKEVRDPAMSSELEYARARDLFIGEVGDRPMNDYTPAQARQYRDKVAAMTKQDGSPMAHETRVKLFNAVQTLFKFARRNDHIDANPFVEVFLEKPKRAVKSVRTEWDQEHLDLLFKSPVYTEGQRARAGCGEAAYWLPVLSLYHGSRLGELCQLLLTDVVTRNGILCLSITDSGENEDGTAKSVKTDSSVRVVPVHKEVLRLGFAAYVASIKRAGSRRLFPKALPDAVGRPGGLFSRFFGRYRKEIGITSRFPDFHSFRHTWKSAARGAGLSEELHDEITGHDNRSVGRTYGNIPVAQLKAAIDKVKYPGITIPKWQSKN